MRAGLRGRRAGIRAEEESGAVVPIVVLSLIAIFAMVVLTIDVGGLLLARREMVNASDAAALAAAQSCASNEDVLVPEGQADAYASQNVSDVITGTTNITDVVGCDTGSGHVSVEYLTHQELFFAQVLGFGDTGDVRTAATAAWGPSAGGMAVPIVIESGFLQGTCEIPDGIAIGDTCALYYNNGDSSLGDANWGFMNLDQWNVDAGESCTSAGSSDRGDWILNDFDEPLVLNGTPPGSESTYVCNDTGHSTRDWQDLFDRMNSPNPVVMFPVNDCDGQLDKSGTVSPCPSTPDKYDIIGFTRLKLIGVYKGNDPVAIGTPGVSGVCVVSKTSLAFGQVKPLSDTYGSGGGCPSGAPDNLDPSDVHVFSKSGAERVQCVPGDLSTTCDYWFDPVLDAITWRSADETDLKFQYGWSMNGMTGACGSRPSDPNAICLLTEWRGFTTASGPIGTGQNFGVSAFALCDLELGTCPSGG
ncbi:MAG: pilus assembly protein TadG-related protein [Actinomycetota bacterium]